MSSRRNKRPYKGLILKPKPIKPGSGFGTGTRSGLGTVSVTASPLALTSTTATTIISFQNGHTTYNVPNSGNVSPSTSSTSTNSLVTKKHIKKSLQNDFKLKSAVNTNNNDNEDNIPSNNGNNIFGVVGDLYDIFDANNFNEFEFLYSIYVPNKYLIKNNRKSIKHLLIHLPKIYHDSTANSSSSTTNTANNNQSTNINLSIHLFLSTIMVKFVNSWYLTKLNTANLQFLKLVYQLMVDFIKDVIARIESVDILLMIDQFGDILNTHLKQTVPTKYSDNNKYPYKFLEDYFSNQKPKLNTFDFDKLTLQVTNDYLKSNHIIFENFNSSSKNHDPSNEMLYYRLLVKNVLLASFKDRELSPSTSKITNDLIVHILSDIVIVKLIEKLSSQDFIFDKLNEILDGLLLLSSSSSTSSSSSNSVESNNVKLEPTFYQSWSGKLQKSIAQVYSGFTNFIVLSSNSKKSQLKGNENSNPATRVSGVLNWSLFSLLNTVFNLQHRKPFFYNLIISIKSLLQMNNRIAGSIDRITGEFIKTKINQSITRDKVARIINDLRVNLFYLSLDDQDPVDIDKKEQVSIDILTDKIIKVYKAYLAKYLDLSYKEETEQDLKDSIKLVLIIFQQKEENESDLQQYLDNRVNKLLIIKLLDCVIGNLYTDI